MSNQSRLFVGTVGEGLWSLAFENAENTNAARLSNGLFIEADVRAIQVHPTIPDRVFVGTNCGLFRSVDAGSTWELLPAGFGTGWPGTTDLTVWSLAISAHNPNQLFAGTCPSGIYRSTDGGDTWARLNAPLALECGHILYPRVTCIVPDPTESGTIWVGVEIDGIRRSRDFGETWETLGTGLSSLDIHAIKIILDGAGKKRILAATNNDLNLSEDNGATWTPCGVKSLFPWAYCRGIAQLPTDPLVLFVGNGNGPPGSSGALQISRDGGGTWMQAKLPHVPNSTVWTFAVSPNTPNTIAAATVSGYIYVSEDAGLTWSKLDREFGEIRAIAWV